MTCVRHRPVVDRSGPLRKKSYTGQPGLYWGVWEVMRCSVCKEERGGRWAKGVHAATARAAAEQYEGLSKASTSQAPAAPKEPATAPSKPLANWPFPASAHDWASDKTTGENHVPEQ